jgi:hypothetical protein
LEQEAYDAVGVDCPDGMRARVASSEQHPARRSRQPPVVFSDPLIG